MKNKDLFEAINKIDDDIVNDAGKYLRPDSLYNAEPVEVRPASKKTSTVKLIAPIAAALAVVCGVTFMVRTQRPSAYSPGAAGVGMTDNEDTSSDIGDGDETSDTSDAESEDTSSDISSVDETSTPTNKQKEDLHKWDYLYNVDEKYLPIGFDGKKLTNEDGLHYLSGNSHDGYEYGGFSPDFVYYAEPKGANYNSVDDPEAFTDGFVTDNSATFKRIAKGDKFGSLTVKDLGTTFARDTANSTDEAPIYYHSSSHMDFNGWLMIEDAYLVRSNGIYYCILRNGDTSLPIINATTLEDGSYGTLPFEGNIGGLEYKTEIPPIVVRIHENQQKILDEYLEEHSYVKARVHITDIQMWLYHDSEYKIYSEGDVISIQSGDAEPKEVAAFINEHTSISELKADLMEKFGFTDVIIRYNFTNWGLLEEYVPDEDALRRVGLYTEDDLILGHAVTVYDENGLCGIYTYGDYK